MRFLTLLTAIFTMGVLASLPARAADYKFSTSIAAQGVKVSSITAKAGQKVLDEDIRWDSKDIEFLQKLLIKKTTRRLNGNDLMADQGARLELTLIKIMPNRPTLHEMTKRIGLNYSSVGLGGAEIEAHLIAADGSDLGTMQYRYFSNNLYDNSTGMTTWFDARRAFDRFSRRLAKELKAESSS